MAELLAILLLGAICFIIGGVYVLRAEDQMDRVNKARLDGLEVSNRIVMDSLQAQKQMLEEWHRQNGGR